MRTASILTFALAAAFAAAPGFTAERDFEKRVQADPNGTVEISNVAGAVNVTGWDRAEVEVTGHLGEDVERVDVTTAGTRITIKVVLPHMSSNDSDALLDVRVPKNAELNVSGVSADLKTSGLLGAQTLKTVSGEIRADLAGPMFEAKTVSGDMRLRGSSKVSNMRVETVSGNVVLDRGAGDIDATTVSGDLRLELDPARSVRMHTTSGDLTFQGSLDPAATLDADTISGDLNLRAGGKSGFAYEASTFSGDIGNCFGKSAQSTSKHGPGSRLDGSVGEGKARVRVKSMSGDVTLCDH
jgi:DUF4097 and DUF4098 domain-containing protein YvlB